MKPSISIHLTHLAQLNLQSAIIIKPALNLQASVINVVICYILPIKNNVWIFLVILPLHSPSAKIQL